MQNDSKHCVAVKCVVCGSSITAGREQYSNAWESSLAQHPCCREACCESFDPTVHWLPVRAPALVEEAEADRLIRSVQRRLSEGEQPGLVARDLLLAGVPPWRVRATLVGAAAKAKGSDRMTGSLNMFAWLQASLTGGFSLFGDPKRGKANVGKLLDANQDIEDWIDRFGEEREP